MTKKFKHDRKSAKSLVSTQLEYISPEECAARGIVKRDGVYKILNTIEKYADKGWLKFGDKRYSSEDRLDVAARFRKDFFLSRLEHMPATDFAADRVDGGGQKELPDSVWDARRRLEKAIKSLKKIHFDIVVAVCLEDRPLRIRKESSAQYNHDLEIAKEYLCRGLDSLLWNYGIKPRRRFQIKIPQNGDFVRNWIADLSS